MDPESAYEPLCSEGVMWKELGVLASESSQSSIFTPDPPAPIFQVLKLQYATMPGLSIVLFKFIFILYA